ncbi:unnamed protein product [Ostreobium quekettii]|uniref:Protein kinase domain-containing protein n=1 Tax=Ostreobium quekettii TaxID=121088 RepID=A0A8S1JB86_9CHLO|nr:unnamed protein product [Ostreobium quekettii]CAD7702721.1 unnamed protein product [Ostreobium quekettii]|eukprot:evm.model.scf_386.2 EVM.evm.TU.scf_386.2   scf_386:16293-17465(+)
MTDELDVVARALATEGYQVREFLSYRRGGSGGRLVLRALDERSDEDVAIKCFRRGPNISRKHLAREVLYHRGLVHKHVVSFKRVFLTPYYLCIVMVYAPHGNLQQWLQRAGCFPEGLARALFQQMVCAVDFCHGKGVFNRDIKLENLLVTVESGAGGQHFKLQLCDFGFSKGRHDSTPKTLAGTWGYIAPEVVKSCYERRGYDGRAADIWSLGICLYRLLYGALPMVATPNRPKKRNWWVGAELNRLTQLIVEIPEVQEVVVEDGLQDISRVSDPCRLLLSRLLCADPRQRITLPELCRTPWFLTDYPADLVGYNERLARDYAADIRNRLDEYLQSEAELEGLVDAAVERVPAGWDQVGSPAIVGGSASNFTTYALPTRSTVQSPDARGV